MGDLLQTVTVGRENLGLGHKAEICALTVHHGQVPCIGLLEFLHDAVHLLVSNDIRRRRLHVVVDMHLVIQFLLEHVPAHIFQGNIALEMIFGINVN